MPGIDASAQRPARNGITPSDLVAARMTLSEVLTGRWTRESRRRRRIRTLLAAVAVNGGAVLGTNRGPIMVDRVPDEVMVAVVGVCARETCCEDGSVPGNGCGTASACGCKVIRHAHHEQVVFGRDDTAHARHRAAAVLENAL